MTTSATGAGAPSHEPEAWHSIDWAKCHREVRRLQARIVKAVREGRYGRVKALQWLLTHSFSGKALAVRRVTENKGRHTPGVDGKLWTTPAARFQAIKSLRRRGYRSLPLKRLLIPKADGKSRPLGVPSMRDRAMQALYMIALSPVAETTADQRSFGFRPQRSVADAIEQCFIVLSKKHAPEWVLEGDIQGYFDNISHEWLMENIPIDRVILSRWLKAGYMEGRQLFPTEAGTPQGGIISPVQANLAPDGLEAKLKSHFGRPRYARNLEIKLKVNYVRYADDFIITGRSKELLENEVMPVVERFMHERGLMLSPTKTRITRIDQGFDFLGHNLRKFSGKLLIRPSGINVSRLLEKVRATVRENPALTQEKLIKKLNPIIQGWADFHRHNVAKAAFARVDHEIWLALWRWCRRRHPQKGKRWIKNRYFRQVGNRNWVFATPTGEYYPDGKPVLKSLRKAPDTRITRHTMLRQGANPFAPEWEAYFEERMSRKMLLSLSGKKRIVTLWQSQQRRCMLCQELITPETGWHVHHIIRRVVGGTDDNSNLCLVHPVCHSQIHALNLKVAKPARASGL
uniref:Group II intron reverse transcriptase/maturase n=1 Tax=Enterobacter cloacae TaxID=550 RepID=A0A1S6XY69_ENTCL|nr:group II intron reverse transcriptase/maturase [Enterobacter cloacae]AQX35370.1 group II intron reverse transcriptase/maturase [Enterobacter cloacae]